VVGEQFRIIAEAPSKFRPDGHTFVQVVDALILVPASQLKEFLKELGKIIDGEHPKWCDSVIGSVLIRLAVRLDSFEGVDVPGIWGSVVQAFKRVTNEGLLDMARTLDAVVSPETAKKLASKAGALLAAMPVNAASIAIPKRPVLVIGMAVVAEFADDNLECFVTALRALEQVDVTATLVRGLIALAKKNVEFIVGKLSHHLLISKMATGEPNLSETIALLYKTTTHSETLPGAMGVFVQSLGRLPGGEGRNVMREIGAALMRKASAAKMKPQWMNVLVTMAEALHDRKGELSEFFKALFDLCLEISVDPSHSCFKDVPALLDLYL
jgi:hypothetical protein